MADGTSQNPTRLLLVTGLSGAGKSSTLRVLEDLGYEAVDNLPLRLVTRLMTTADPNPDHAADRPVAIGVDSRTRAFHEHLVVDQIEELRQHPNLEVRLLFLDCSDNELARRFSETRRRHPLASDRPVADGIAREREMLLGMRDIADYVCDTTGFTINDLRQRLSDMFAPEKPLTLTLSVMSFGYAHGLPRDADLVFDMRFLRNPHYVDELRPLSGRDESVAAYIAADPYFLATFDKMSDLILSLLPRYREEGKSYLTLAIGCTGGRHRSVFVAEMLTRLLEKRGYRVNIIHRDLDRGRNETKTSA